MFQNIKNTSVSDDATIKNCQDLVPKEQRQLFHDIQKNPRSVPQNWSFKKVAYMNHKALRINPFLSRKLSSPYC